MSRRTLASVLVACLLLSLFSAAMLLPVPYVMMSPGPTVDVLGKRADRTIIEVDGHPTYPTEGDLRLTTVSVTKPPCGFANLTRSSELNRAMTSTVPTFVNPAGG